MEIILIILLIAVFYFLLIRPQQRQRRHLQDVQSSLTPGTKVMTGSGLIGTVTSVTDDRVELEVAPGVTNTYVRRAIVQVVGDETATPNIAADEGTGQRESAENSDAAAEEPSNRRDDPGGSAG